METTRIPGEAKTEAWTDEQVVERVLAGETALYEVIMRRYNQRLYRVVRAILRDDSETEDVMQDALVRAYEHLSQFEGRASFSTWLTRIAVHEALARVRRQSRNQQLDESDFDGESPLNYESASPNPEKTTSEAELRQLLEEAVLALPEQFRIVVMLRDIEELSTSETAAALEITEENVKVRLHRGRALIRRDLFARVGETAKETFSFMGVRCDRMVQRVFRRLAESSAKDPSVM